MNKILKFKEYSDWEQISLDFLNQISNPIISESEEDDSYLQKIVKDILNKFGFNIELSLTFGTGLKVILPVVSSLIENMALEFQPTTEDTVLLCITIMSIMYLQNGRDELISANDIKNKLNPEIQMKFGNPRIVVNRFIECFNQIFIFLKEFPKLFGFALSNILDLFIYSTILLPIMNAIGSFCSKYELTPETLLGNLVSLSVGIVSLGAKKLLTDVVNKVKNRNSDQPVETPNVDDLEEVDMGKSKLIQEQ